MKEKMNRVNRYFSEHTVSACVVIAAVVMACRTGLWAILSHLPAVQQYIEIHTFAVVLAYYVLPLAFVFAFGYEWIFRRGRFFKTQGVGFFLVCFIIFQCLACYGRLPDEVVFVDNAHITDGFIYILGIRFFEETIFRGIISNKLGKRFGRDAKGVWKAVVISGVIFGFMHLQNVFHGVQFVPALAQSIVAMATGMLITAIYYRGGSIFAVILMHAFVDFGPLFAATFTVGDAEQAAVINGLSLASIVIAVPIVLVVIWILRKSRMPEIIENLAEGYPRVSSIKRRRTSLKQKINKIRDGANHGLMLQV